MRMVRIEGKPDAKMSGASGNLTGLDRCVAVIVEALNHPADSLPRWLMRRYRLHKKIENLGRLDQISIAGEFLGCTQGETGVCCCGDAGCRGNLRPVLALDRSFEP